MIKNLSASIRQKLFNYSKKHAEEFNSLLVKFGIHRILYRLSVSVYCDQFLLKGSWLFMVWTRQLHRPTKDADLLQVGNNNIDELALIFKEICAIDGEDGLDFKLETLKADLINEANRYHGVRISWLIASTMNLENILLAEAILTTFTARSTRISSDTLYIFSDDFKVNNTKVIQWNNFLKKNRINHAIEFPEVINKLKLFLEPIYIKCSTPINEKLTWDTNQWAWDKAE